MLRWNLSFKYNRILIILIFSLFCQGSDFVINPETNSSTHNNKGTVYLRERNYLAAIQEFRIAIALNPNKPATALYYNNLGLAYNRVKKHDWAQTCFERAIEINPNFFEYYRNLVAEYKHQETLEKNLKKYKDLTVSDSLNSTAWLFLGLVYEELNQVNKAIESYRNYSFIEQDLILTNAVKKHVYNLNQEYNL